MEPPRYPPLRDAGPADGEPLEVLKTEMTFSPGSLYVNVDWSDLVERHMGDLSAAFDELGKLKDFLA